MLNREIVKIIALPDMKKLMAELGFGPVANTPDEFAAQIKSEIAKWAAVIKTANIKIE